MQHVNLGSADTSWIHIFTADISLFFASSSLRTSNTLRRHFRKLAKIQARKSVYPSHVHTT